jgi:thymidylate kinase
MRDQPLVVAFEGPCCAGKTTLARTMLHRLTGLAVGFAPCYADQAGGGRFLPRQEAESVAERERALIHLLSVEADPLAALPPASDLILADRSVHTLLANSYALERMNRIRFLSPSERLLRHSPVPAWPDLIIYLDLPQSVLRQRNHGKFPRGRRWWSSRLTTWTVSPVPSVTPTTGAATRCRGRRWLTGQSSVTTSFAPAMWPR